MFAGQHVFGLASQAEETRAMALEQAPHRGVRPDVVCVKLDRVLEAYVNGEE